MTLRVAVLPADTAGCGYYRAIWPAMAVRDIRPEWQIDIYHPSQVQISQHDDGRVKAIRGMHNPSAYDLVVTQRVGRLGSESLMSHLQQHFGVAVVIDADDAMWCIDPANPAYRGWNSDERRGHWRVLDRAAAAADLVTVTTDALANRYGKRTAVATIPNYIPTKVPTLLSLRANYAHSLTVGWTGSVATHPNDLPVAGPAVRAAARYYDAHVVIVGSGERVEDKWGVKPHHVTGSLSLEDYHQHLSLLDVGLVPLEDSRFNRAKSWLKALEFSAMGVPVVASDTPANRALARDLPIRLASKESDWVAHLTDLVKRPELGTEAGHRARVRVAESFTIEGHAEDWASAWERAVARRRKLASV